MLDFEKEYDEELAECPVCNDKVMRCDLIWTHDCHGIVMRKVCPKCYENIVEDKGYDGEYYTEADECIDYDY